MRGRALKISAPRRLVGDLMRFSIGIPRVTVQRQMNLGPLLAARGRRSRSGPSWTVLFLKGYGLLCAGDAGTAPRLRQAALAAFLRVPVSVASVAHEREHDGERVVLLGSIKGPERRSIPDLQAMIAAARSRPVRKSRSSGAR